jgi:hypothetical protein
MSNEQAKPDMIEFLKAATERQQQAADRLLKRIKEVFNTDEYCAELDRVFKQQRRAL